MRKKQKQLKQSSNPWIRFWVRIFRFFVPKDWHEELAKGMMMGEKMRRGEISPKIFPTYHLGKALRRIVDPKHKMFSKKDKEKESK